MTFIKKLLAVPVLLLVAGLTACGSSSDDSAESCTSVAPDALRMCISTVNTLAQNCYAENGVACGKDNEGFVTALSTLENKIENACGDGELLSLSVDAAVGRLQNSCQSQADSMAWRTYGGPQGAVWDTATAEDKNCLQTAYSTVSELVDSSLASINLCLEQGNCETSVIDGEIETAAATAISTITAACPSLQNLVAVEPTSYVERALDQVDCTVATSHANTDPLSLECGPSNVDTMPARGQWSELILDGEKWGTLCGDGTDYAMHIRLAPVGNPLDKVVVAMQGGGVCTGNIGDAAPETCTQALATYPERFNAQGDDDMPLESGVLSTTNAENPFKDWTMVYLPYCNQDVFAGGGVIETISNELDLPRFGAINLRSGVQVARDIIWKQMDDEGGAGFRPDELVALFGGFSAGGYGTLYNYHWMLDDLQWPRTAAFPDGGGALDNARPFGVKLVGFTQMPQWNATPNMPPYCFSGDCAVGPVMYEASAPRLKQVPEQQYLILSNQRDQIQQGDAYFVEPLFLFEWDWMNAIRSAYCTTKDLNGIQWYLTSAPDATHVVSIRDEFFYGEVAGETMVDWMWRAVSEPDSIEDRADEGNYVTDIPGTNAFNCQLPGVFL